MTQKPSASAIKGFVNNIKIGEFLYYGVNNINYSINREIFYKVKIS